MQILSPREVEVLRLIAKGSRVKEIGAELRIRDGTVKTHIEHIRMKLEARSLPEAVAKAMDLGLLSATSHGRQDPEPEIVREGVLEPD